MTPERFTWVWNDSGHGPMRCNETVVTEVEAPGDWGNGTFPLIVTDRMNIYRSYPVLNLFNGETEELWLTKTQVEKYQQSSTSLSNEKNTPDPRTFELPTIGLTRPDRTEPELQGFSEASSWNLVKDDAGHLWCGRLNEPSMRPYMHHCNPKARKNSHPPELRFLYPYITYIGPDEGDIWMNPWGDSKRKVRLTICTYEVHNVIEDLGMRNSYFPTGLARTHVEAAQKECSALRKFLMRTLIQAEDSAKSQLKAARQQASCFEKEAETAQLELGKLKKELEAARKDAPTSTTIKQWAKEAADAIKRAERAENALETARENNTGWDWSAVLDDD
jgi:hypothetical protein